MIDVDACYERLLIAHSTAWSLQSRRLLAPPLRHLRWCQRDALGSVC